MAAEVALHWKKLQVFFWHHCITHSSIMLYIMRSPISLYPTLATSPLWAVRNQRPLGIHDTSTEPSLSETRKWRGTMWDQWHPRKWQHATGREVCQYLVVTFIYRVQCVFYLYIHVLYMYWEPNLPGFWSLYTLILHSRAFDDVVYIVAYINNFDSD